MIIVAYSITFCLTQFRLAIGYILSPDRAATMHAARLLLLPTSGDC